VQCSSRVSACRRELNSHNAAKPRAVVSLHGPSRPRSTQRLRGAVKRVALLQQGDQDHAGESTATDLAPLCRLERQHCVGTAELQFVRGPLAASHRQPSSPRAAGSETRSARFACAEREAPRARQQNECRPLTPPPRPQCRVLPNPSVNRTRYGKSPWPGWRYAVHFRHPGQGVLPPRAGYLER